MSLSNPAPESGGGWGRGGEGGMDGPESQKGKINPHQKTKLLTTLL